MRYKTRCVIILKKKGSSRPNMLVTAEFSPLKLTWGNLTIIISLSSLLCYLLICFLGSQAWIDFLVSSIFTILGAAPREKEKLKRSMHAVHELSWLLFRAWQDGVQGVLHLGEVWCLASLCRPELIGSQHLHACSMNPLIRWSWDNILPPFFFICHV